MTMTSFLGIAAPQTSSTEFPCPNCDVLPWETLRDLQDHQKICDGKRYGAPASTSGFAKGTASARRFDAPANGPKAITEPQSTFIRKLLAEREGNPAAEGVRMALNSLRSEGKLTSARASQIIEALKAVPRNQVVPAAQAPRTNRFAGKCEECRTTVEAGEGILTKSDEGKWEVAHKAGECPASDFPFPYGSYAVNNAEGEIRFYSVSTEGLFVLASDNLHRVHPNAQDAIIAAIAADPEAASIAFGHAWQTCGRCGRGLTDTKPGGSRERGIGPVCAGKGW